MCSAIVTLAKRQQDQTVIAEAEFVAQKFKKIFYLFGNCHTLYNKSNLNDDDITTLGQFLLFHI